jgi:hypothetical protein
MVKRYWFDVRRNEQEIPGMRGYVESEDYDALLALARRFRKMIVNIDSGAMDVSGLDMLAILGGSEWLEEKV